jgi:hypothetical protein
MTMEIDKFLTKRWYNENKELHRDNDLPAVEFVFGDKCWYVNGKRHRDNNLPAIERANGDKHWYVNGNFIIVIMDCLL